MAKKSMDEVKQLIDLGKEKGFLTYDEVNDILPPDIVSSEQIDDVMSMFGEMDIEIVDSVQKVKIPKVKLELEEEEDGRWSAWIDALPGCAVWGYTREEAIEALKDAAQAYLEVMVEKGQRIPVADTVETIDAPVVAVTL